LHEVCIKAISRSRVRLFSLHAENERRNAFGVSTEAHCELPLALPTIAKTQRPVDARDWWHTTDELTMVKIPAGSVQGDYGPIRIHRDFWLSDREITVHLFWRFVKDDEYWGPKPASVPISGTPISARPISAVPTSVVPLSAMPWGGPYSFPRLSAEA
jgi:hypothetical protein